MTDWLMTNTLHSNVFDSSLDYGQNWWPVDENFAEDPQFLLSNGRAGCAFTKMLPLSSYGASDDFWLIVDGEIRFLDVGY